MIRRTRYTVRETGQEALEAALEAAVARIEKVYGPDWFMKIDLARLDLSDGAYCVLGQLENIRHPHRRDPGVAYAAGEKRLGWDSPVLIECKGGRSLLAEKAALYAVNEGRVPYDGPDKDGYQRTVYTDYSQLEKLWRKKIAALRAAGGREV
jgi:hypothetical protein